MLGSGEAGSFVGEDREDVCEIADAGEEEKEHRDSLGGFTAVVEEELGDAGGEVENCAEVAEDLAEGGEGGCGWVFGVVVGFVGGGGGG